MGFDPRNWSAGRGPTQRVTSNVDALLAENDALRREVFRLTRELERIQRKQRRQVWREPSGQAPPRVSAEQISLWGDALACQPGWSSLRQAGLQSLIERLSRSGFPSQLPLQQRLDRLVPGLGTDLFAAVGSRQSKKGTAVLAAFALYGVRASEWLEEDPSRVVADLRQRQTETGRGRRTSSDNRSSDRHRHDPRAAALAVLGLEPGATLEAIKQAHRRMVKHHHPDLGGSAEAFRRVTEAYQSLIA